MVSAPSYMPIDEEHKEYIIIESLVGYFGYDVEKFKVDELDSLIEAIREEVRQEAYKMKGKKLNDYGKHLYWHW